MRRWRIPIAFAALLGLAGYVYFFEIKSGEEKQKKKEESEKVLSFQNDQITAMTLTRPGETIRLEKSAGHWTIQKPLPAAPDSDAVDRLLTSLQSMRISHDLGRQPDPSPYNLQNPPVSLELTVQGGKQPPALFLGDDSPTGGGAYARLGQDGQILIVSGAEALRGATLLSLRDRTFFKFDPAKLAGFKLYRDKEEIALQKQEGKWSLQSPVRAPAEDSTMSDLISSLERLTVTEFVEEKPSSATLAKKGLAPPRIKVALHGEEWKTDPELSVGASDAGSLYAIHPGSGALVKISDSIEPKLKSSPMDLRKKDLMPIQRWDLESLRITGALPAALELKRRGEKEWDRVSPEPGILPDEPVDILLRSLTDLKAEGFLDKPSAKLGTYGLDPPHAKLEFRQQGEEGSNPIVLEIGKSDGHGRIYMRQNPWPSVLLVQESIWQRASEQIGKVAQEKPQPATSAQSQPATAAIPAKK
ncbi:MAG: DUF4340 domain-containing protein [Acidobacteria bacterium]|nr:DUF4340 domain-containing protein [Acidobacteriota bacterium]